MKVLIVSPEFPPDHGGGIITFYRDLTQALVQLGCEVHVLKGSAYVNGQPDYEIDGIKVSVLQTKRFTDWIERFGHFSMFPDLQRHLAAAFAMHEQALECEAFDAVEVTDWGLLFLPWMLSSKSSVLVQLHGSCGQIAYHEPVAGREAEGAFEFLLERAGLAAASSLSSYSKANVAWWENMLGCAVSYLPPPLDLKLQGSAVARLGWVSFGRIQHWKGPQVACAAWQRLGQNAPPLDWHGRDTSHGASGLATSAWLAKLYPQVWGKTISHCPQLPPDEVSAKMRSSKAVVIPSEWDVFNLVTAEAMACGCVVLVSTGAGASDLIEHGRNGFVFPAGDDQALADIVRTVEAMSDEKRELMGSAAARTVIERLDPIAVARQKLKLYQNNLASTSTASLWLLDVLLPEQSATRASFLDALPLRDLAAYVRDRAIRKLTGRKI